MYYKTESPKLQVFFKSWLFQIFRFSDLVTCLSHSRIWIYAFHFNIIYGTYCNSVFASKWMLLPCFWQGRPLFIMQRKRSVLWCLCKESFPTLCTLDRAKLARASVWFIYLSQLGQRWSPWQPAWIDQCKVGLGWPIFSGTVENVLYQKFNFLISAASLNPTLWKMGILLYKLATLHKHFGPAHCSRI